MFFNKYKIILIPLLLVTFISFSQEKDKTRKLPSSIYTTVFKKTANLNSKYHINQRLRLTSYQFMFLKLRNIEEGYFNIPMYPIYNPPTEFIYDSYNKLYSNLQLQKSFFKIADLYKVREKNKK
ncbi:hypothetical protein Lupro_10655 [Lutibacter profundi]|uniref:Uncharacterized protein n=1 Tax=Lutibacter profundi TaxID=1622118 RepID=A0A0X8G809_9FLAO|nr:hypothetical protein [Lutibacter profundi]AMC11699.1 hypothetical protein Lupro_10655 [Lutibacter profundi]